MADSPYNPLDKTHLGESVARALLSSAPTPLPPTNPFIGAGIYALYYTGDFPAYRKIAERNSNEQWAMPIYVGKAVPPGARKGGYGLGEAPGQALYRRLCEHAESIKQANNLSLDHFFCRYLVVDDIWIPLGEALLISTFSPLWNRAIDGFGNHDPGAGRYNQRRSLWDELHPGRSWAARLQPAARPSADILIVVETFLADHTG
ncbi:MAG: Eco29kI family restriction endonuclease [Blastocatellales bacterium]